MESETVATHLTKSPIIHETAFVAPGANVLGAVTLGQDASVWYQVVLRADIESIEIGEGSNIQDGSVVHLASDEGTRVGSFTTVGHKVILHACDVGDEVLVGMGAIVMDGARIGSRCLIAAGSLVSKGFEAPAGSLVMGSPARVVRSLSQEEQVGLRSWAEKYIRVAREHRDFLASEK